MALFYMTLLSYISRLYPVSHRHCEITMYKISVFIPESHLEPVKIAMFEAGAGRIGDYDHCAWQCLGQGQFRPLQNSRPFMGKHGKLETVQEYKVEMVCEDAQIRAAITAMHQAHPYEEPAYDVWKLEEL